MSKGLRVFLILLLLMALFTPTYTSALRFPPHENPRTAREELEALGLLTTLVDVYEHACAEEYGSAREQLKSLLEADMPEEYRYIIERIVNMTSELIDILDEAERTLEEARDLISKRLIDKARDKLDRAGFLLSKASILLSDIEDSINALSSRIQIRTSMEAELRNKLSELMDRLEDLIAEYRELLEELRSACEEIHRQLRETEITLRCNTSEAFLGSPVKFSGALTSLGEPLGGRIVRITMDGVNASVITETLTAPNGSFTCVITIPYIYRDNLTFRAVFLPEGEDRDVFLGSVSEGVIIKLLFYRTQISLTCADEGHPGTPFEIWGIVSANSNPSEGRFIRVLMDGAEVANSTSGPDGSFYVSFVIPESVEFGNHSLLIIVEPSGLLSGALKRVEIMIRPFKVRLLVEVPRVLFIPLNCRIKGVVISELGPLANACICLKVFGRSFRTLTDQNGSFTISIPYFSAPVWIGDISIHVSPEERCFSKAEVSARVVIINIVSMGLIIVSLAMVGVMLRPAPEGRKEALKKVARKTPGAKKALQVETTKRTISGPLRSVIETYFECARIVSERLGISMEPYMTLREFLSEASSADGSVIKPFSEITFLAERAMYSNIPVSDADVRRALELYRRVREALRG